MVPLLSSTKERPLSWTEAFRLESAFVSDTRTHDLVRETTTQTMI